jgi:hypothetical protein
VAIAETTEPPALTLNAKIGERDVSAVHAVGVPADASAGDVPSILPADLPGRSWPAGRRYLAAPRRVAPSGNRPSEG